MLSIRENNIPKIEGKRITEANDTLDTASERFMLSMRQNSTPAIERKGIEEANNIFDRVSKQFANGYEPDKFSKYIKDLIDVANIYYAHYERKKKIDWLIGARQTLFLIAQWTFEHAQTFFGADKSPTIKEQDDIANRLIESILIIHALDKEKIAFNKKMLKSKHKPSNKLKDTFKDKQCKKLHSDIDILIDKLEKLRVVTPLSDLKLGAKSRMDAQSIMRGVEEVKVSPVLPQDKLLSIQEKMPMISQFHIEMDPPKQIVVPIEPEVKREQSLFKEKAHEWNSAKNNNLQSKKCSFLTFGRNHKKIENKSKAQDEKIIQASVNSSKPGKRSTFSHNYDFGMKRKIEKTLTETPVIKRYKKN
jgi:hypothetical protein